MTKFIHYFTFYTLIIFMCILDIGKGGEFSLRALFDQNNLSVEPEEQCLDVPHEPVARKAQRIVFEKEVESHVEQQSYWKNAGMWSEPLFFSTGDTRFKG